MRLGWLGRLLPLGVIACCARPPSYAPPPAWEAHRNSAPTINWNIVRTLPHSTNSYTEGLEFTNGRLYESVGRYGESKIVELDPRDGRTVASYESPKVPKGSDDPFYGEGIAIVRDSLLQLSWKSHVGARWDLGTMKVSGWVKYDTEGWGLCHDGTRYVRSDGTSSLKLHDASFAMIGSVDVLLDNAPVSNLNELECVGSRVYANVWQTPFVVRIDLGSGKVDGVLDLQPLVVDAAAKGSESVLNGIAVDAGSGHVFVTGKLWSKIYILSLVN